jgi:hypothetical protein
MVPFALICSAASGYLLLPVLSGWFLLPAIRRSILDAALTCSSGGSGSRLSDYARA